MLSPNEFWLNVHRLSAAYDAEGTSTKERTVNICCRFQQMPQLAQQEILQELHHLVIYLPELYPVVAAAAQAARSSREPGAGHREDVA